jgi:hypothetical protein
VIYATGRKFSLLQYLFRPAQGWQDLAQVAAFLPRVINDDLDTNIHAFVADVHTRPGDEFLNFSLTLAAKAATQF